MDVIEFENKYCCEMGIYKSWGDFVTQTVVEQVKKSFNPDYFFKIEPKARVKSVDSLVAKAFFRGKQYTDPYNDITDKVGTRFVVLISEHIQVLKSIIEKCEYWSYSLDRDFEKEKESKPTLFEYQSIHYVVRSREVNAYNGINIPRGTPCEIQIRTLLQHAYAELTHDTIYKPINSVPRDIHRVVAKSMALIETTDGLFSEANRMIEMEARENQLFISQLNSIFSTIVDGPYEERLNLYLLDSLKEIVSIDEIADIKQFVQDNSSIRDIILRKFNYNILYRQPIILLLYYLINTRQRKFLEQWPLPPYYLESLFSDLGYSMPNWSN